MRLKGLLILFIFKGFVGYAGEDLISERPGQALSPNCLDKGSVQVQTGYNYSTHNYTGPVLFNGGKEFRSYSNRLKNTVVRFGLGNKFEINSSLDYNVDSRAVRTPLVGFKAALYDNDGSQLSVQYNTIIHQFNDELFTSNLKLISNNRLTNISNFSWNSGIEYAPEENKVGGNYVMSLSISPTKKVGMVLENYGDYMEEFKTYFDFGIGYLITPVLQIDTYFGGGINQREEEFFINGGVTYRFDLKSDE